jgi:hypothetical protein
MTEPTPAVPETAAAAPPATPKPKAPRKESTRVAAAEKIARTHPDPKALLGLLADDAGQKIEAEAEALAKSESDLATKRAQHRVQRTFVEETEGLDQMSMVGIKAILVARSQQ